MCYQKTVKKETLLFAGILLYQTKMTHAIHLVVILGEMQWIIWKVHRLYRIQPRDYPKKSIKFIWKEAKFSWFALSSRVVFICSKHPLFDNSGKSHKRNFAYQISFEGWREREEERASTLQNCIVINKMAKLAQNMYT